MKTKKSRKKNNLLQKIKNRFTAGILATVPITVSVYVLWIIFSNLDKIIGSQLEKVLDFYIPGIGFVVLVLVVWFVGVITSGYLGSRLLKFQELMLTKIPVLGTIFRTIKQLSSSVLGEGKKAFQQAVLLEVFNKGSYSIGFITSKKAVKIANSKKKYVHVFMPTAINPASGFMVLVEESKLLKLDMSVEEAFKTVVAAGMVYPAAYK